MLIILYIFRLEMKTLFIYLRNIRARVLNSDLSPINLKGRAIMTLLLK